MTTTQTTTGAENITNVRQEAGMASNMMKFVSLVLLIFLHFSHGTDPQPEQIHLSSTGKEKEKLSN